MPLKGIRNDKPREKLVGEPSTWSSLLVKASKGIFRWERKENIKKWSVMQLWLVVWCMLLIFNSLESSLGALEIVYAAAVSRFISDSGKKKH